MALLHCVIFMFIVLRVCLPVQAESQSKNVTSKYTPDIDLPTPKIVSRHGYPSESHEIVTEDGYILTLHRIPYGRNGKPHQQRPPIFLQHGVIGSSADWVINGPNRSIAYQMADRGYDVWLGNVRGNTYSKGHINLSPNDDAFWNFSFHEVGMYDLPAAIDYVLNRTNQPKLYYIGHSMGTTVFYVLCSMRPEYNNKVITMFSFAPIGFMSRTKSPIKYIAPFATDIQYVFKLLGPGEFLPQSGVIHFFARVACEQTIFEARICENYLFMLCGYDPVEFNTDLLPVILTHTPAGTSTKTLVHFAQEIKSGKFQQYDYGSDNMQKYNASIPPSYNLSLVRVPVSLHYGENDLLANVLDVQQLFSSLPNSVGMYRVNYSRFNHLDFIWSIGIQELLNNQVEAMIGTPTAHLLDKKFMASKFRLESLTHVEDTSTDSPTIQFVKVVKKQYDGVREAVPRNINELKKQLDPTERINHISNTVKEKWQQVSNQLPDVRKTFNTSIQKFKDIFKVTLVE